MCGDQKGLVQNPEIQGPPAQTLQMSTYEKQDADSPSVSALKAAAPVFTSVN